MKRMGLTAVVGLSLALPFAGCTRTRLAKRPLAPYERAWSELIRHSYPRWHPPAYPEVARPDRPTSQSVPAPQAPSVDRAPAATQDVELVPLTPDGGNAKH
ncbi:MAG: hypothetical protein GXP31_07320 [Kiritimatiellaeota bacterium]|nr:hypothetical protein [Kiritimatiellota bacterium]